MIRTRQSATRLGWLGLAAVLAIFGFARTQEGWRLEPLDAFVHAQWWGLPQTERPVRLSDWRPSSGNGRTWAAYSQVLLEEANRRSGTVEVAGARAEAEAATLRALALGPAESAAWARLALLQVNGSRRGEALAALDLSLQTGPDARGISWLRSRLGLYLWEDLNSSQREGIGTDIRRLWRQQPSAGLPYPRQALVRFAHGVGRLDAVREALPIGERAQLAARLQSVLREIAGGS